MSQSPRGFFLNSQYKLLKIHQQGAFKSTYIRNSGASITIPFPGLNYRPLVLVYCQRRKHDDTTDPTYHLLEWSYWGATKVGYQRVKVYKDKFILDYSDMIVDDFGNNFSFQGYYYVFREEVRE